MNVNLNSFDFMLPTAIRFGFGIHREIGTELIKMNKKSIMIITDKGLVEAGIVEKVESVLRSSGLENIVVFNEVEPNPRDTTVEKAAEIAKLNNVDALIAIGGGSSMDTAKGAGIIMECGGTIKDYEGLDKVPKKILTLFAIPTTVGTGSEVTFWAVIKDTKENYKLSIGSQFMAPTIAFIDPELVETLPPSIIAATGMDALTHAIEGYTCSLAEPITDACGIYAIELISDSLRDAVYTLDKEARAKMLLGSLIAGICFGNADVAGGHCMSESLGGLYDTPHGVANAVMLPYIMEFNYVANLEKFARIAGALGVNTYFMSKRDAAYEAIKAVKKLNSDLNIPTLREIGAEKRDIDELATRSSNNVSVDSNPRKITKKDFKKLFESAFED